MSFILESEVIAKMTDESEYPFYSIIRLPKHSDYFGRYSITEVGDYVDEGDYEHQYLLNPKCKPYKFKTEKSAIFMLNRLLREDQIDPEYYIVELHQKRVL